MAQEAGEEDRSKKRKKWLENLSVISSEEEEEYLHTSAKIEEEKLSILNSNKVVYLRFPYYMGSDNSDDDDSIKYFHDVSPCKRDKKKIVSSSSDEINVISKENHSHKHTKRKRKSDLGLKNKVGNIHNKQHFSGKSEKMSQKLKNHHHNKAEKKSSLSNRENKENSMKVLKYKEEKSAKKTRERKNSQVSAPHNKYSLKSAKVTQDFSSAESSEIENKKVALKSSSLRQRRGRAHSSTCVSFDNEKDSRNIAVKSDAEFQSNDQRSSRFLDSSSENSNTEITKTKHTKFRRVRLLSTSEEDNKISDVARHPKHLRHLDSDEEHAKAPSKQGTKVNLVVNTSSEDEDYNDLSFEPPNNKKNSNISEPAVTNNQTVNTNSVGFGSFNSQEKSTINTDAWKSIAIADIKAQFNKQSRVEELKRKLVSSNASSVAIYKKIQNREMLRNKSKLQRPVYRPHLNKKQTLPQSKKQTPSESKFCIVPTTSAHQKHEQTSVDSTLRSQVKESSYSNLKLSFHSGIPQAKDSFTENAENSDLLKSSSQSNLDSSLLEDDAKMSLYHKKIRHAHNKGKNQNEKCGPIKFNPQLKIPDLSFKQTQLSNENKPKESKQILDDTSANCDVLGNIMSQMDNNPYKVQKPANKKIESTTEMLGWFPAGSNASPLFGHSQTATGPQLTKIDDLKSNLNFPTGANLPAMNKTPVATNNTVNPSYNPLSSAVTSSSNVKQTDIGIGKKAYTKIRSQEDFKVTKCKQVSKIDQPNSGNALNILHKSCSGERFVPFYSAPQDDYVGKDVTSKKEITNTEKSIKLISESKTYNQNSSSNNKPPHFNDTKSKDKILEGHSNNSIRQERGASKIPPNNLLAKGSLSAVNTSENSHKLLKINTNPINRKQSNSERKIVDPIVPKEPVIMGPFQPQAPLAFGFPRGNGAVRKELRNDCINNNAQKGIRIRLGGAEFRLPLKESDKSATNVSESKGRISDDGPPVTAPIGQTSISGLNSSSIGIHKAIEHKDGVENMACVIKVVPVKSASSSSTTSQSSPNDSSSSSDDSSSESSDESGKPSSGEDSTSDGRGSRVESPVLKNTSNNDKTNLSLNAAELHDHSNSQEQTQSAPNDEIYSSLQPTQDSLICTRTATKTSPVAKSVNVMPNKPTEFKNPNKPQLCSTKINEEGSSNNFIDEVIVLSGSSDSDSNDQSHDKEIRSQTLVKVDKNADPSDNIVDYLQNLNFSPLAENNQLSSNNVGKIRVKSFKELGITADKPENENALKPAQVNEVSQKHSKEKQDNQLDIPSSSATNTVRDNQIQPEETNSDILIPSGIPIKKSMNPVTTVFLPIVPIAVINPLNSVRVRPTVSSLNQRKNIGSNLFAGGINSSQIQTVASTPTQDIPSQIVASRTTESSTSNQEISLNPATVVAMPFQSEDVESLFFNLCDELFTDVVLFKIPKLVDDLHLLIAYDIMKEERLKKIDQLISPETIISEKRRAEKDFADMIKIRGQSFVPLFMTIMNRINNKDIKSLITAVYCKIVQQLERVDPVNSVYRYKIRNIIKSMLQKYNSGVRQEILAYFETENDSTFLSHFIFIEDLLRKYDKYVEERQADGIQNKDAASGTSHPPVETLGNPNATQERNDVGNSSIGTCLADDPAQSSHINLSGFNTTSGQTPNVPAKPPPPSIGNLDKMFLKKNTKQ